MVTKELINQRFIESVNFLISSKIAKNKAEIADKLKIARSKISEILNGRMSIGIDDLANYIIIYNLNSEWFFTGKGEIRNENTFKNPENNNEILLKDELIKSLKSNNEILLRYNKRLEEDIEELKRQERRIIEDH